MKVQAGFVYPSRRESTRTDVRRGMRVVDALRQLSKVRANVADNLAAREKGLSVIGTDYGYMRNGVLRKMGATATRMTGTLNAYLADGPEEVRETPAARTEGLRNRVVNVLCHMGLGRLAGPGRLVERELRRSNEDMQRVFEVQLAEMGVVVQDPVDVGKPASS
jgi:hypothetical protein